MSDLMALLVWTIALAPIFAIVVVSLRDHKQTLRLRMQNKKKLEQFQQLIKEATGEK